MRAFLQSLDEKVWLAIWVGWTKPTDQPASWDDDKIKTANFNSKALNALFNAMANEEFKKIASTKSANEAWIILQNTYASTKAMKDSKLQRLTTSFEEIRMDDGEAFDEFYANLKGRVNFAFNLGEKILEPKIMRKILRSLPEWFHAKITIIEESKDIDSIELIRNLQTYELGLVRIDKGSKSMNMALKAKNDEEDESSKDENSKFKSYITRQFKKFIKNANVKV